jgi:hypothetical protein
MRRQLILSYALLAAQLQMTEAFKYHLALVTVHICNIYALYSRSICLLNPLPLTCGSSRCPGLPRC